MALGDAFCVATALAHNAKIYTGDPEIIRAQGNWKVQDLR
jgi:PIN domain nuclease of toxin-antitoxin system